MVSVERLSEEAGAYYGAYLVAIFRVLWNVSGLSATLILLVRVSWFTFEIVTPFIVVVLLAFWMTYIIRFVLFGYRVMIMMWKELRPPHNSTDLEWTFSFVDDSVEFDTRGEAVQFVAWLLYGAMFVWTIISGLVLWKKQQVAGFFQYTLDLVPETSLQIGLWITTAILGRGGIPNQTEISLADVIGTLMYIPMLFLGLLIVWNFLYELEASDFEEMNDDSGRADILGRKELALYGRASKTFLEAFLDRIGEALGRILKPVVLWGGLVILLGNVIERLAIFPL